MNADSISHHEKTHNSLNYAKISTNQPQLNLSSKMLDMKKAF